jgi:YD repeat-containing protein
LESTSWGYDAANQLKTTSDGVTGISTASSYDAGGQLQSWSQSGATGQLANLTFSFNANGDRTQSTDSVSTTTRNYGYNQADNLTSYTSGSTSARYSYNGDGLRTSRTVNGSAANQVWDLAEGLPTIIQDGATKYITGPGGLPIEQVTGSTPQYYLQDQLGSTRGLTDSSGAVVATYTYDAYGAVTASTGTASTPFQYAGQYTDGESGLQYLRARYYDPQTRGCLKRLHEAASR